MALLLLPPPPDPPTSSGVDVAFGPPLRSSLRKLLSYSSCFSSLPSSSSSPSPRIDIDIALPCPQYILPPASSPAKLPSLLFQLYTLIHSIAVEESQSLSANASTLNPRIILLSYPSPIDYYTPLLTKVVPASASCFVDLAVLALSDQPWSQVFIVDGESGERLHRQFMSVVNGRFSSRVGGTWTTHRVRGGLSLRVKSSNNPASAISTIPSPAMEAGDTTLRGKKEGDAEVGPESREDEQWKVTKKRKRFIIYGPFSPMTVQKKVQVSVALLLAEFGGVLDPQISRPGTGTTVHSWILENEAALAPQMELASFVQATVGLNPVRMWSPAKDILTFEPFNVVCLEDLSGLEAYLGASEGELMESVVVLVGDKSVRAIVEDVSSRVKSSISIFEIGEDGEGN